MNIFVNHLKYASSFKIKNTDLLITRNFGYLGEVYPSCSVRFNNSIISNLALIIPYIARHFLGRKFMPFLIDPLLETTILFPWQLRDIDVIYTHGIRVRLLFTKKNIPIVMDSGFMTNQYTGAVSDLDRIDEVMKLKNIFKNIDIVALSSKDAIIRLSRLAPELEHKLRCAPTYLLSKLDTATTAEVKKKYVKFDEVNISFIGRQGDRKGIENFFLAIEQIKIHHLSIFKKLSITIISNEPLWKQRFLNLSEKIEFKLEAAYFEVKKIMRKSHIFCLPTKKEAFGLVYLEAMASGCVVIADNRQPRLEIFRGENSAYLVDPLNVNEICEAILDIVKNKEKSLKFALESRKKFKENYSKEAVAKKYIELFNEAISNQDTSYQL